MELALDDRRGFRLLYARYADRLYWYALARCGSAAIADDVVSETMLAALENLERFDRRRGTFATWLFTIGHRKLVDEQRHHRRVWRFVTGRGARASVTEEQDALEQVIRGEDAAEVYRAFRQLGAPDQEVLALRYSAGLSSVEIGDVLGISSAAARKRLSRARNRLERLLKERGFDG